MKSNYVLRYICIEIKEIALTFHYALVVWSEIEILSQGKCLSKFPQVGELDMVLTTNLLVGARHWG